ncbi:MAG TPA: hypothetical protein VH500_25215 [Nitrososphaeraceae archaeon]
MITGSYLIIVGLDSAAFYIATDSSLRGIITRSPRHEYDFLKSIGCTDPEHIVTDKVSASSSTIKIFFILSIVNQFQSRITTDYP